MLQIFNYFFYNIISQILKYRITSSNMTFNLNPEYSYNVCIITHIDN